MPNICLAQDSNCLASYSRFNFSLFPIFTKAKENLTFWFWGKCLWVDAWIYWTILSSLIFNSLHIYSSLLNLNIHLCRGVGGERDLARKDLRRHLARLHAAHQPMERSQVCHCQSYQSYHCHHQSDDPISVTWIVKNLLKIVATANVLTK